MTKGLKYINGSLLFERKHIEENYRFVCEADLQKELDSYREYCLQTAAETTAESKSPLSVWAESSTVSMPDESLLKQCALYVNNVIVDDPVFSQTSPGNKFTEVLNSYLGMSPSGGIDRRRLAQSAAYMNHLLPAIRAGFVEFLPISYLHEPPDQIPLTYSENWHADALPKELLDWFTAAAEIHPMRRSERGWCFSDKEPLKPCRAICIRFKDHPTHTNALFFLSQMTRMSVDKQTGMFEFIQTFPDTPPETEYFNAWIFQSVNQAARNFFYHVCRELYLGNRTGSTYLTASPFVAELLSKAWFRESNLETDVFNAVLQLNLPVLEGVSFERVIDLRQKDGEAFQNFRVELAKQLRELRQINDPDELAVSIQNVAHELSEVQVNEIDRKVAKIKRGLFADAVIFGGGLVATIQTKGLGIPALIYAMEKGYKTYSEYISDVKQNPAFFLWKLVK